MVLEPRSVRGLYWRLYITCAQLVYGLPPVRLSSSMRPNQVGFLHLMLNMKSEDSEQDWPAPHELSRSTARRLLDPNNHSICMFCFRVCGRLLMIAFGNSIVRMTIGSYFGLIGSCMDLFLATNSQQYDQQWNTT